jgi:mycothiol synthase
MPAPRVLHVERIERLDETTTRAVEEMLGRAAIHARHSPIGEHKFVRLVEGEADTFGLLASASGEVVGYAQATTFPARGRLPRRLAAELLVDPAHRGGGIGRALFERLLATARRDGAERFDVWAHHADAAATGLATAYRMRISRQLWQMALELESVASRHRSLQAPDGIRLRPFQSGVDEERLLAVIRDAFGEHPENADFDAEDLAARSILPWFDASAILLAEDTTSGETLGVHWMKLDEAQAVGEVYMLGVAASAQGRGVGRLLLLSGLEEMRRRGLALGFLYVDADSLAAVRLYRSAGFRHEHLDTCYSLDLDPRT